MGFSLFELDLDAGSKVVDGGGDEGFEGFDSLVDIGLADFMGELGFDLGFFLGPV